MATQNSPSRRGSSFEHRVLSAIKKLEAIGFARELNPQDRVRDRDGNIRKIDLSFVLCTYVIELLITVECKSRDRPLSLNDINQIKTFKQELPERNLFWLVVDGSIADTALAALKSAGIAFYQIEQLEAIIDDIHAKYVRSGIDIRREATDMLSAECSIAYESSIKELMARELELLAPFQEIHSALAKIFHEQTNNGNDV